MNKGFATTTILLIALGILVVGGIGYVAMNPQLVQAPAKSGVNGDTEITWHFTESGERDNIPYTSVAVSVNGTLYEIGEFMGSCSEIGATGGIDGQGLLAGELSAMQCWFAGSGNEIGVFAHEDGGYDLMVGELSEGAEEVGMFRGDFEIKHTILP